MASANTCLPANPSPHTETAKHRGENLADKLKQDSDNGHEILESLSDTILEGIKDRSYTNTVVQVGFLLSFFSLFFKNFK